MLNTNLNLLGVHNGLGGKPNPPNPFQNFYVEALAIAGGGRGGVDIGGGGGAGGYKYISNYLIYSGLSYTVAIGAGQPSWKTSGNVCGADPDAGYSISGSNTFIYNISNTNNFYTMGGGAASCGGTIQQPVFPASNGGSGGGGRAFNGSGGNGYTDTNSYIQGYAGGASGQNDYTTGGGGGGAAQTGSHGNDNTYLSSIGGAGGNGKADLTLPTAIYRAGGGTGAYSAAPSASIGGGGYFCTASISSILNGKPNYGGGGGSGAGSADDGGQGGSGFAQFKYPGPQRAYGGEVYEYKNVFGDVLYTVHSFTASGVFQPIR